MVKKLVIVDISSFIFRAFFAIRPLHAPDGTPVNAVYGILQMVSKLLEEQKPTHLLLARDTKEGSFRNDIYSDYKANRSAPPEELIPQFSLIDELVDKMNLPSVRMVGYEADDIIGSAAVQFKEDFDEVIIASGDKDLMQFVGGNVTMLDTMKSKSYDRQAVYEKMGVYPEQIVDYLSLVGDSSDNIPGVRGIGAKGAAKLLEEYGSLENCLKHREEVRAKRTREGLVNDEDNALLSKKLVQIVTDLDLQVDDQKLLLEFYPSDELLDFLRSLGFKGSVQKLEGLGDRIVQNKKVVLDFNEIKDIKEFLPAIEKLSNHQPVGVSVYWQPESSQYQVYWCSFAINDQLYLLTKESAGKGLALLLEKKIWLVGNGLKEICSFLEQQGFPYYAQFFDIGTASFNIDPSQKHTLSMVAQNYAERRVREFVLEKKEENYLEINKDIVLERAQVAKELFPILEERLRELEVQKVFETIDIPLIPILARMEVEGVNLDGQYLKELENRFSKELQEIQSSVDEHGGKDVNLKSPKQVGELLFEKLQLPVIKRTKTGFSTDSEVLEKLAKQGQSEIPSLILKYRELDKLQSTYVKSLPKMINSVTQKVHTTFQGFNAATGRLSSEHPNLQNIPVRTQNGCMIRKAFIAGPGNYLLGADYSQVELRILAHFSQDPTMIKAFKDRIDIHKQTAAEVLGISINDVSKEERSNAKAVNFGLMYGQSSFGLAQTLGISRREAKEYITHYFKRFSKIKGYLDSLKELAESKGYSETLFGRKRFIPDIRSQNRAIKSMAERVAINSPIQGTAADIIKKAMIDLQVELSKGKFAAKLVLQVHDELILEVPEKEVEVVQNIVIEKMENAVELSVPLKVEAGVAKNWFDLK